MLLLRANGTIASTLDLGRDSHFHSYDRLRSRYGIMSYGRSGCRSDDSGGGCNASFMSLDG